MQSWSWGGRVVDASVLVLLLVGVVLACMNISLFSSHATGEGESSRGTRVSLPSVPELLLGVGEGVSLLVIVSVSVWLGV